jgi:hypothetical protein
MPKRLPSSNKESMLLGDDLISEDLISLDSEEDQETKVQARKTLPNVKHPTGINSGGELPVQVKSKPVGK